VVAFSRDPLTGTLTFLESHGKPIATGGYIASEIHLSADGRFVYATGQTEDGVDVFARDVLTARSPPSRP
jgi:hypothetical protein